MKSSWLVGAAGTTLLISTASAHPSAANVAEELKGKLCTTRSGSYLHFAADGHYGYDGLWRDGGHYAITRDAVTITLKNGLQRAYAIAMRDGVLYMDRVALSCEPFVEQVAEAQ
jgi:hypothetical protein